CGAARRAGVGQRPRADGQPAAVTFDSLTFVVFLAAIFAGYWTVRSWTARKVFLLAASYLFYAAWNPFFVLLIIATTGFDWLASHWMDRGQTPAYRQAIPPLQML